MFEESKWIWIKENGADTYAEFVDFLSYERGDAVLHLSVDSDYTLFINGRFVSSNQQSDFEHYKLYDSIPLTEYLKKGNNTVAVLVWYFGKDTQRYKKSSAGLIYEMQIDGKPVLKSGESTLSRLSEPYENGRQKWITRQLGFGYHYDLRKEDGWESVSDKPSAEKLAFKPPVVVEKHCSFYPRATKKLLYGNTQYGTLIKRDGKTFLFDLGRETVGLLNIKFLAKNGQKINVSYSESLDKNGRVRRKIGKRDFSVDLTAKDGENEYVNYMLRFACRYMEVSGADDVIFLGLLEERYPVSEKKQKAVEPYKRLYEMCVNTLKLSMMEHYVDCPWREQCLYTFDSRNQMLSGYAVFENKNKEYARANLTMFAMDRRIDGFLSVCSPCGADLTIPSFSLYYLLALKEYIEATNDKSILDVAMPKVKEILESFLKTERDGLLYKIPDSTHWAFYDWSKYLEGHLGEDEPYEADLIENVLLCLALSWAKTLYKEAGEKYPYKEKIKAYKEKIKSTFYNETDGAFDFLPVKQGKKQYTALGNALAVLAGITDKREEKNICEKIVNGEFTMPSLAMETFVYDALIKADEKKYKPYILKSILTDYEPMIKSGSTTVWETSEGESAFDGAGSLCHGWSAIPVVYLQRFSLIKEADER